MPPRLTARYARIRNRRIANTNRITLTTEDHVPCISGAHPASYLMGTSGSFPGIKRLGRIADYSPPSSAEVKE